MRAVLLLLGSLGCASAALAQPAIEFDASRQTVRVSGLDQHVLQSLVLAHPDDSALRRVFGVYLGDSRTAMLGDYEIDSRVLRFTPRFPLLAHRAHRAELDLEKLYALAGLTAPAGAGKLQLGFTTGGPPAVARTRVLAFYPTAATVPANLLRVYVQFSQPMPRRGTEKYIRLEDENGKPVGHAFLEMTDGLWDPEGCRLTLFLHPGRIKRGLILNESLGPPLQAGRRYRFVVSTVATDQDGEPLAEEFSRWFRVSPADRTTPDPRKWTISAPPAGSKGPLVVVADRPLDHFLFARLVRAEDEEGHPMPGEASVSAEDTRWEFVPAKPWKEGRYHLRVGAELEDLAGNRPTRLFDEPAAPAGARAEAREVFVSFEIRSAR